MSSAGLLVLRIGAGLGLATHGYQTIFESGIDGFAGYLESLQFPMPAAMAWTAKLSELVGGVLVAVGWFSRVAALFAASTMAVAILTAHLGDPFKDWELAALYCAAMLTVMLAGPGKLSIDGITSSRRGHQ